MKYKLIRRENPQDRTKAKWYPMAVNMGVVNLNRIAENIEKGSTLSKSEILHVLHSFLKELPLRLVEGYSVQLDGFGTMRISLSSKEGTTTPEDFSSDHIHAKIVLTSGFFMKNLLDRIDYRQVTNEE